MRTSFLLLGLAGVFLGWNLPNHYPLWTTFHGELVAAIGLCLLFAGTLVGAGSPAKTGAALAQEPAMRLALPSAARAWLLLALLPPLQYIAGLLDFRGDALLGFLYALGVSMGIYTGYVWAAQAGPATTLRALFLTVVWAAIAAAGLAFVQWVRLPTPGWWAMDLIESRPFANFGQPNLFGLSMVMGIVAATALFEMRVLQSRFTFYLLAVFFGCALLICQSRASVVGVVSVAVFWLVARRRQPSRLRIHEVVILLALGGILAHGLPGLEEALYLRAAAARSLLEVGPREPIWLHFLAAIDAHPWRGYGFGQGVLALREVATQVQPSRNTIYAHNLVLDLMTWFGVPLGLALTVALAAWMLGWLRRGENAEQTLQRHAVFAFWLALLVQSLLEFPFAHAFFLLPASLLAGAITSLPRPAVPSVPGLRFRPAVPATLVAAIGTLTLGLTAWDYLQFEDEFRANRFDKANFTTRATHESHRGPIMLDQLAALNASAHYSIRAGMPASEIDTLRRVARRFHLLPSRIAYAKALALNGSMPQALAELRMMQSVLPVAHYAQVDRDWRAWLAENEAALR